MKFQELLNRLSDSMTEIQVRQEAIKMIENDEAVEINGTIIDIGSQIFLGCDGFNRNIHVLFNPDKFTKILQSFQKGTKVKVIAKIGPAPHKNYVISFHAITFLLVSISEEVPSIIHPHELKSQQSQKVLDNQKNKDGCFIATACYGNYNAPEVLVLRHFRDKILIHTYFGKYLIKFYYYLSPIFASLIAKSGLLKKFVRKFLLDPIVILLKQTI